MTIRGTRMILRGDQWFPRRGRISVHVGEPLFPGGNDFAAAVRLRDRCRAIILERSCEPDRRGSGWTWHRIEPTDRCIE